MADVLGAVGGGVGIAKSLFGTGSSSQGSSQSGYDLGMPGQSQQGVAGEFANQIRNQTGINQAGIEQQQRNFNNYQNTARDSSANLQKNFGSANLNTEFAGPQFGQGLDATANQLISSERGAQQAGLQRNLQGLSQQFRNNPALAKILGSQATAQSQLASNPLAFQAMQEQRGREIQQNQATNQAQGLTNDARLAQTGSQNQAGQLGNQAQLQQQNSVLSALQNAGNFGQAQNQMGQQLIGNQQSGLGTFGKQVQNQQQSGRAGGLFAK